MAVIRVTISLAAFLAHLLLEVHDMTTEGQMQASLPSFLEISVFYTELL